MMNSLLKHVVDLTGHRDHRLLDISILSAVRELAGAQQARVLGVYTFKGEMFLRARAWIADGNVVAADENQSAESPEEPITRYPALAECLQAHGNRAQQTNDAGEHLLWLPVWLNDDISACLEISRTSPYSRKTLDVIEGILSVYRNFQHLLDYSERDSLTGLLNRKTFDENFSKIQSSASQQLSVPLAQVERRMNADTKEQWLAVVDIDHFKHVNDQFGHLYGDEVLILVSNLMKSSFRSLDRIFRFGGEEFVVLIRSATSENAHMIAERFRRNVENYVFPQVGKITVSIGYTSFQPTESPVVILGHADQALYYAKTHGRNQACHYEELVAEGLLHAEVSNDTVEFF
jgi:diguanylate cyclase (GGDEF)-like protein